METCYLLSLFDNMSSKVLRFDILKLIYFPLKYYQNKLKT